ncbi:unnamed protein product, partial [Brachionus calyciflorus]
IIDRYNETKSYKDRPRPSRPRISTEKDDRNLVRLVKKNRTEPSHVLENQWKLSNGKTASSFLVSTNNLISKKYPQLHFKGHFYLLSNPPFNWRCSLAHAKTNGKTKGEQYDFEILNEVHIDDSDIESTDSLLLKERRQPSILAETLIPETLKFTKQGENFLLYESGIMDNELFLIFGTRKNLEIFENNHIFCDGTFKVCPKLLVQLYTMHALVEGCLVPVLFVLLTRKNQAIYEKMPVVVKSFLSLDPKSFNVDFELAFLNAVKTVFPRSVVNGCYFHFRKSMLSEIQDLGLTVDCHLNKEINRFLKIPQMKT